MARNETLQRICREYLSRLRRVAQKHGVLGFVNDTIRANKRGECSATQKEVEMLARLCDDERVSRLDVPKMLGKSYRQCNDDGDFDKVKKLRRVGIYDKISVMLLASKRKL